MIKVLFYSGYKGEEKPRFLLSGNEEFPVQILRAEEREDYKRRKRKTIFYFLAIGKKWRLEKEGAGYQIYEE